MNEIQELIGLFYRSINEEGGKTKHQPSGKQIAWWLEKYGCAATEQGIMRIKSFLQKMPEKVIRTDKDAQWMINYLNVCVKGCAEAVEKGGGAAIRPCASHRRKEQESIRIV